LGVQLLFGRKYYKRKQLKSTKLAIMRTSGGRPQIGRAKGVEW